MREEIEMRHEKQLTHLAELSPTPGRSRETLIGAKGSTVPERNARTSQAVRSGRWSSVVAMTFAIILTACGGDGGDGMPVSPNPAMGGLGLTADLLTQLETVPASALSDFERESLLYMREEEKFAYDMYVQLDGLFVNRSRIFSNIAQSEATHAETVLMLLARYELIDPVASLAPGQFADPTLQALYRELIALGSTDWISALRVGARIEEADIMELERDLLGIDNADIRLVYNALLESSRSHLRAFVDVLQQQGVVYVPVLMTDEDYAEVIGAAVQ